MNPDSPMARIVRVRKHREIPQASIAELLNISKAAWSSKERGDIKGFSFDDVQTIINYLQVDARWVFGQIEIPLEMALLDKHDNISNSKFMTSDINEEYNVNSSKGKEEITNILNSFEDLIIKNDSERKRLMDDFKKFKEKLNKSL